MSSAAFAIVTLVAHALSCSSVPYKVTRRASGPVASATSFTRRDLALGTAAIATALGYDRPAFAADEEFKTVVVAGATGQTGRRCLSRLGAMKGVKAIGGVRDPTKAAQKLAESKVGAPGAPLSNSNGGGGTTMDDNLKKISDNVNRSVEQKQINPTPTS